MAKKSLSGFDINAPLLLTGSTGTSGQALVSQGAGVAPIWQTITGSGGSGLTASNYLTVGYLASNQVITSGSDVSPNFVSSSDPQGWWNATTKRFTPTAAGYYQVEYYVHWQTGTSNANQINGQIQKNNGSSALFQDPVNTASGPAHVLGGSKIVYLNGSTDYVNFTVYTANPTSQTIVGTSDGAWTHFSAFLITGSSGTFNFSTTAPSSPSAGDRWTDANSGITYTYVNDGNSSQWVEMGVSALLPAAVSQSSLTKTITSTASTTYSTSATDAGTMVQTTATSAVAITITNTLTAGQFIDFVQYGAGGQITFSAGTGVTLVSSGTKLKTSAQYAVASVQCLSSGVYLLFGDLSA